MKQIAALLVLFLAGTAMSAELDSTNPLSTEEVFLNPEITNTPSTISATKYRKFKNNDGTEIQALLLSYWEQIETVKIELSNGSQQTKQLSDFSIEDQAYILDDWLPACSLLSKNILRTSAYEGINKRTVRFNYRDRKKIGNEWNSTSPNMGYGEGWYPRSGADYDEIGYNITLNNSGGVPLNNIWIEYCIYGNTTIREQKYEMKYQIDELEDDRTHAHWARAGSGDKLRKRVASNTVTGTLFVPELSRQNNMSVKTKKLHLMKDAKETYAHDSPVSGNKLYRTGREREIKGELLGIRYRVYFPIASEGYAMKEFAKPKSLLKETVWPVE